MGIRCIIYIDDILLLHQDRIQLARSMVVTLSLLQLQAGLNVKTTKCAFHPSQRFQCLGYVWDTVQMKVFVPSSRLKETHRMARRLFRLAAATTPISNPCLRPASWHVSWGRSSPPSEGFEGHDDICCICNMRWDRRYARPAGMEWQPSPQTLFEHYNGGAPMNPGNAMDIG